ncbi:MAG: ribosome silencing factor [Planctomycetes bacterium]|nr:ribosome silencing factor [Planctomycetota bacterium]
MPRREPRARSASEPDRVAAKALAADPMRTLALDVAAFLDSKRALEIRVFDVSATLPICTYFVLATGTSARHVQALADGTVRLLRARASGRAAVDGTREARWVCIDHGDVVVHLFDPEAREFYGLDYLWGDAPELHFTPRTPISGETR